MLYESGGEIPNIYKLYLHSNWRCYPESGDVSWRHRGDLNQAGEVVG